MSSPDEPKLERWLTEALDLGEDERTYLASLNLAAPWKARASVKARSAGVTGSWWGWLALFSVFAAFVAWTVAAQPVGQALSTANMLGASTLMLNAAIGLLLHTVQAVIDLSTSPALSLSQPSLALLGLALLLWPRLKSWSAPIPMQGVRS